VRSHRHLWPTFAPALVAFAIVSFPEGASGTVEGQRARLPPPAECEDPIEGVWRSHAFDAPYQQWQQFTLEIHRNAENPGILYGTATNNAWDGDAAMTEPGPCQGLLHFFVTMQAAGSYNETTHDVHFGGINWNLDQIYCGSSLGFGYNLDQFRGTVDPEIQEFQSLNNDGGRAVNVPTVFRRIECFDSANDTATGPTPGVDVRPPSLYPRGGSGCNRRRR